MLAEAALRLRRELADRLDLVAEELEAVRRLGVGREHIEDAAAPAELAGQLDRLRVPVAVLDQPGRQLFEIDRLPRTQPAARGGELSAIGHRLKQRLQRRQDQTRRIGAFELFEQAKTLAGDLIDSAVPRMSPLARKSSQAGNTSGLSPVKLVRSPVQPSMSRG